MNPRSGLDAGSWPALEPPFTALREDEPTADGVPAWLARWSNLQRAVWEARAAHLEATPARS